MGTRELKTNVMTALLNRDIWSQKVSNIQLRTRCPWCGDSHKNQNTGHLYIRIDPNDNKAMVYNCFKCPAHGILTYSDLEVLGIQDVVTKDDLIQLNKNADKMSYTDKLSDLHFEYSIPDIYDERKIHYIRNRMGIECNSSQLADMKVVTSLKDFLMINNIHHITCKKELALLFERNYVGFLSSNNAYLLLRDITDKEDIVWFKYPITEASQGQRVLYSIRNDIDLFSLDPITINLSEGVFDAIGVNYHISDDSNTLNLAICGKHYVNTIKYLIGMGFLGMNVTLNIYSDRDYKYDTSIEYHKKILKPFTYVFKEVNVYYNTLKKDCGVRKEDILLQKHKI